LLAAGINFIQCIKEIQNINALLIDGQMNVTCTLTKKMKKKCYKHKNAQVNPAHLSFDLVFVDALFCLTCAVNSQSALLLYT
jgi:hypothetical protein